MLSKNDLQQIKEIVKTEVRSAIQTEVPPIVDEKLVPIKKDIRSIKIKLNRIVRDVRYIARDFDERLVANTKEIEKLKN